MIDLNNPQFNLMQPHRSDRTGVEAASLQNRKFTYKTDKAAVSGINRPELVACIVNV